MMKRFLILAIGVVFLLTARYSHAMSGEVSEAQTGQGIGNLTVVVTPPKSSDEPQHIITTDKEGKFDLQGLQSDRQLIEIYQGQKLLYRNVVDVKQSAPKKIELRRK